MLADRAQAQRTRTFGHHLIIGGELAFVPSDRPEVAGASINRRTGQPHEHARAKARGLKHIANLAPLGALLQAARAAA